MIADPQRKVRSVCKPIVDSAPTVARSKSNTSPVSLARIISGIKTAALSKFEYHASRMASPWTTGSERLITTACKDVVTDEINPKAIPTGDEPVIEDGLSMRMPTKKPAVTRKHEVRIWFEGRVWSIYDDSATVNGRTKPRAT